MAAFSESRAIKIVSTFLKDLRQSVDQRSLNTNRLPGWIKAAKVRAGWINETLVAVFEDSSQGDTYEIRGRVDADTVILLDVRNFSPSGASHQATRNPEFIILVGMGIGPSPGNQGRGTTNLNMIGKNPALFDCGYFGYHGPRALFNVFLHTPQGSNTIPIAARYIPFALYIHVNDTQRVSHIWKQCEQHLMDLLTEIHESEFGDFYESLNSRTVTLESMKQSSVIVLGKYADSDMQELLQVRDFLRSKGYQAELIKDLPEFPAMSNEEKVRFWTLASRFSVVVDREASGHIKEHEIAKQQRCILGLLRQRGLGSTYMIGDEHLVDINYIRVFEFDKSPIEALPDTIQWAEKVTRNRADAYNEYYPWRRSSA